jgi:hypothetical protein
VKRWRGVAALFGLAAALAACQVLVGVSDEEGAPRPTGTGTTPGADLCPHEAPAPPPQGAQDGPDQAPAWFALTTLEGLPRPDGRPVGFDLDKRCTGFPAPTAFDGGALCASAIVDENGGVDNATSRLFGALPGGYGKALFDGFRAQARGTRTLLVYLARYNGQPNDPSVVARLVASEALQSTSCDGGAPTGDGGALLEGCDTWAFPQGALTPSDGGATPAVLHEGYVSEGRLVLGTKSALELEVEVARGTFPLPLSGAVLDARISEKVGAQGATVRTLTGTIAGRVSVSALLAAFARQPALCAAPELEAYKRAACAYRDMPGSLSDDPLRACTHLSVGLAFSSVQARLGGPVAPTPPTPPCALPIPSCE